MFIQVNLLRGYRQPLWYKVENVDVQVGSFVYVPLKNKTVSALVVKAQIQRPAVNFEIKAIYAQALFPDDTNYMYFLQNVATYYCIQPITLVRRIAQFLSSSQAQESSAKQMENANFEQKTTHVQYTDEQKAIIEQVTPYVHTPMFKPMILHGVTGSGKTEVYCAMMKEAYQQQRSTLFLVPEVTLAIQFQQRLAKRLPTIPVYGFHSASSNKEKKEVWQKLCVQEPIILVGVHLPVLLPMSTLGLIIVDEEHEAGFQEKKHPKINSKEAALIRARDYKIPIVLGSATPSVATLYNTKHKNWECFTLSKRYAGSFPVITTVSLRAQEKRKTFWVTKKLCEALEDRLRKQEQAILFLNRRGFSFFLQCKSCGFILTCTQCSVSLTLHEGGKLLCHYCGLHMIEPTACRQCKAQESWLKKGIGTQQLVHIIKTLFPQARVERADLDATVNRKKWQETVRKMQQGEIDILIGTQTITKGYDFPNVTLVGVVWADLNVHMPVYNAAEKALQQLIQVSGRAGRHKQESVVIVQTMSDHAIFSYISEEQYYTTFYEREIAARQEVGYPPYVRLVEIEMSNTNEEVLVCEARHVVQELQNYVQQHNVSVTILGPAAPPVQQIKKVFFRKIYLKSKNIREIYMVLRQLEKNAYKSAKTLCFNPL